MPHFGTFTILDYSEETSTTKVHHGAITAASIGGFLTQFGAYRTAIDGVILGTIQREAITMDSTVLSNTPPVSPAAQVELKWLVTYEGDTTGKKFRLELPTPDTQFLIPGSDQADLTAVAIAAYITAFETLARSPDDDEETVTVLGIALVGRNN